MAFDLYTNQYSLLIELALRCCNYIHGFCVGVRQEAIISLSHERI